MNWARGLFRLWLVLFGVWSLPWIVAAGAWLNNDVLNGTVYLYRDCAYSTRVPVSATDSEVKLAADESFQRKDAFCSRSANPYDKFDTEQAIDEFHAALARRPEQLRSAFLIGFAFWVIPPAFIFAVGAALLWALIGFRKPQ